MYSAVKSLLDCSMVMPKMQPLCIEQRFKCDNSLSKEAPAPCPTSLCASPLKNFFAQICVLAQSRGSIKYAYIYGGLRTNVIQNKNFSLALNKVPEVCLHCVPRTGSAVRCSAEICGCFSESRCVVRLDSGTTLMDLVADGVQMEKQKNKSDNVLGLNRANMEAL